MHEVARRTALEASPAPAGFSIRSAAGIGLSVTLVQLLLVMSLSGESRPEAMYRSLLKWDAKGPGGSNVAFFPGYPIAGKLVSTLPGCTLRAGMLLAAQLAAWGFWTYLLLLLRQLRTPKKWALTVVVLMAVHPAAFFLVVGYSESLFLLGMLGFLYWSLLNSKGYWLIAAAHGIVMSSTRIVGLPLAFCPMLAWLIIKLSGGEVAAPRRAISWRKLSGPWLLGAAASMGGLAFFAYCQWRFGAWDLYMQTQQIGWNVHADWLWWLRAESYTFFASAMYPNVLWPDDVSRFIVLATVIAITALGVLEIRLATRCSSGWQQRMVFYLAAVTLFFVHAAGVSPIQMKSMLRYCLGVHLLLLLALAHLIPRSRYQNSGRSLMAGLIAAAAVLAGLQLCLAWRYVNWLWVA